ncbi:unnamed protein product [Acanthosepion pharaonis]|uniref:Uncharacterized protein n=1 Tax=Acanthosepion pharaonis TaxID=158019 RepID=A0A812CCC1_ACAPH|nr:unnamed protein product [Sepia pharaonis]
MTRSEGVADRDIVSETLKLATEGNLVFVVAEITGILVPFLFYFSLDRTDLYMRSDRKKSQEKLKKLHNIRELTEKTNSYVCKICQLSIRGMAVTVFVRVECEIITLIHKSKEIHTSCATLADATASPVQVTSVGSQILVNMYGGKPGDTPDFLRYIKYTE